MTDEPGPEQRGVARAAKASKQAWHLYVIIVLLIVSFGLPFLLNNQRTNQIQSQARRIQADAAKEKSDLQCVTDWANATAARSDRILSLSNAKNAAADDVFRAVAAKNAGAFTAALSRYLAASNAYNIALKAHPLPPSPQLACNVATAKPSASPPLVVVTTTAPGGAVATTTMTHSATATVGVPQPTTVTAPGAPVPMPGETVTRTVIRTRTVTRTVSPPSCLKIHLPPCVLQVGQ